MSRFCVLTIQVTDLNEAINFYENVLGFEVSRLYEGGCIALLKHEGMSVVLNKVERIAATDYPHETQVVPAMETPDIEAALADFKAKGVDVVMEHPQPCPPGLFSAIRDPFGNVIELIQFSQEETV